MADDDRAGSVVAGQRDPRRFADQGGGGVSAAAGRHPVPQIVQKEIAPDYLWNAKSSDLQSVVIENILKELAAENENAAREGKRPFKFVGVRAAQKHTQYEGPPSRAAHRSPPALVLCELQQNVGAGLANACTCHWDSSTDGGVHHPAGDASS